MNENIVELATQEGNARLKQEGRYIHVDYKRSIPYRGKWDERYDINIPLFYDIALFTSQRRAYKTVMKEFFDRLQQEKITGFFTTRENLESATQACGVPGGNIAFWLGVFCRYYGKLPRSVNVVWSRCEECAGGTSCGTLKKCGEYCGCGKGVTASLEPAFNLKAIPEVRKAIKEELFPCPKTE